MNELELEKEIINILGERENGWTYRQDIKTEKALWDNIRNHMDRVNIAILEEKLLTDTEFERVKSEFKRLTATPFSAAQWLRGENGIAKIDIEREDNKKISLVLFSNKDIAGGISIYEIVNQITIHGKQEMRGDITLLINGLPIIHIELKTEYAKDGYTQAYAQIADFAKQGFFEGIFATVQIFVVSNKVGTKYFARPTNGDFESSKQFLFNWRTPENEHVENLYDFTRQVLSIPMAHELVSKYTILVDDKKSQKFLMVLRPYQIHAIKKIIHQAAMHEGGFIWHATGSGKTITSFVATKLLAQKSIGVARTIMVVDRKDLDSQTKNEFSKFASEYHTGQDANSNTLIIGTGNRAELARNLISGKNASNIIVTTIQKLSLAVKNAKENESSKLLKLQGEHLVFIVDECHRAVSDEEMKNIKKLFPRSTWFGFTGTPIFEENKKQENGTFARTTFDQYGELLHAYTTKNAMDDKSVLDFAVEYHSLVSEEYEEEIEELKNTHFESDEYINAMLAKIFKRSNIIQKFKVIDGMPTMSAILTTHSIAQAKRIYHKIQALKAEGTLLNGKFLDETKQLNDPDFPRVAVTYSVSTPEGEQDRSKKIEADEELKQIMEQYNMQFGTTFDDVDRYNKNINERLARKSAQYKKDGNWLDLVIVVDRLLTGFDAPTIQTLFVDKELKYQGLLQAFSRTNRKHAGKDKGLIVTFRKPETMRKNVSDAMKLFSNEDREWENLIPKEYKAVKKELKEAFSSFVHAKNKIDNGSDDLKDQLQAIKTFNQLAKVTKAIKSYEDFGEELEELENITELTHKEAGNIENLKAEVKNKLEDLSENDDDLEKALEIEFSGDLKADFKEKIDSYYIYQLLKDNDREKLNKAIETKPAHIKEIYAQATAENIREQLQNKIDELLANFAKDIKAPINDIRISFNEYKGEEVPYINIIKEKSELTKEEVESFFKCKYRERLKAMESYFKTILDEKLMPIKEELK